MPRVFLWCRVSGYTLGCVCFIILISNEIQTDAVPQITEEIIVANEVASETNVPYTEEIYVQEDIQNELTETAAEDDVVIAESVVEAGVEEPVSIVATNDVVIEKNATDNSNVTKQQLGRESIETDLLNEARKLHPRVDL